MSGLVEHKCNNCGHEGINTRVVPEGVHTAHIPSPDVPELVRYAPVTLFDGTASAAKTWNGDYVLHSQAAAIIAARDVVIEKIAELQKMAFRRAEVAEAELAHIKAQEPVAWMYVNEDGECEQIEYGEIFDDPHVTPLYAAPVEQTAEIERLKEVLRKAHASFENDRTGKSNDIQDEINKVLSGKESK